MPQHSQRYLERRSTHKTKPISEHIAHFKKRLLERFDITFTTAEYDKLLSQIHETLPIYAINGSTKVFETHIQGKQVWILYGNKSDRQPARLKTALIPYTGYIVPDCLSEVFDHKTFTVAVKETIDYFVQLSDKLDINDPIKKKEFFTQQSAHRTALAGAYFYKKNRLNKDSLVHLAVRHLKYLNNIEVEEDEN